MTTQTSIYEYAKQGLVLSADKPAIWFCGRGITYRELFKRIDNAADHLYALGVREGTAVTIHLPNCPETVVSIYAVAKLGGICNMVHPLTPESVLREIMTFTESEFLLSHMPFSGEKAITLENFSVLEEPFGKQANAPEQSALAMKCAFYLHSSGTTGKPKTIMLSHSAINHCVKNTAEFFDDWDVTLAALPLSHIFGLTMDMHRNISLGSEMVQMAKWDAAGAVHLIQKHRVSAMLVVPKMCYALLNEPGFRGEGISQLRHCYVGGDNVEPQLIKAFDERVGHGHCLFPGFGLSEATINCVNRPSHYKVGSVGYPMSDTEIGVLDAEEKLKSHGEGELVISSQTLMMGYLNDREATNQALLEINDKRWVRTGDRVRIDEDGFLFFKDRIKNVIIHNGYNIYPGEIENLLRTLACVDTSCAVGVYNSETHTEDVLAVIVLHDGVEPKEAERQIRKACVDGLPKYAIPKYLRFTDALPFTAAGKVDRAKAKEFL